MAGRRPAPASYALPAERARALWLHAQRLDTFAPFGAGPAATLEAVRHLGYVQIDTINVIERSHHHILHTRIPAYARDDLARAQSADKTVFEYWTHALAYVPAEDYRFFIPAMRRYRQEPPTWFGTVEPAEYRRLIRRIRDEGPLSIRDIDDDVLVEKHHPWASRKPSKRALQVGFFSGDLTISARSGMVKTYELTDRHFGWPPRPRTATDNQYAEYLLARALRSQGLITLESASRGDAAFKPAIRALVEAALRRKRLVPVHFEGDERTRFWVEPSLLETAPQSAADGPVHILSPFDPLVIQRRRLALFFGYEHRFEAYLPAEKRVLGYFALPVLVGDRIVAALDLKTDRQAGRLLVQKWTWIAEASAALKVKIEEALARFERFQLDRAASQGAELSLLPIETGQQG
ncbi:MAG TPA: crosslink repair DNA glycosylase YcaQ family protein [Devosia sp.]|nr:crosslink repair DNA glycosylase YcaQ family protein [Devosia sp.]